MSFRCEHETCKRVVEAGQPENRVVTEQRTKTYENYDKRTKEIKTTEGRETVREIRVCPECFKLLTGDDPKQRITEVKVVAQKVYTPREEKREFRRPRRPYNNRQESRPPRPERKAPVVEVVNKPSVVKG